MFVGSSWTVTELIKHSVGVSFIQIQFMHVFMLILNKIYLLQHNVDVFRKYLGWLHPSTAQPAHQCYDQGSQ